jgi:hypothetical protein
MELLPLIITTASVVGTSGAVALIIRERMWLRHNRYLHDQAVALGQDPDPVQLIQAARAGRLQQVTEQVREAITGKPKASPTPGITLRTHHQQASQPSQDEQHDRQKPEKDHP